MDLKSCYQNTSHKDAETEKSRSSFVKSVRMTLKVSSKKSSHDDTDDAAHSNYHCVKKLLHKKTEYHRSLPHKTFQLFPLYSGVDFGLDGLDPKI